MNASPTWRDVWRALVPHFRRAGLVALREALQTDDPRLIHGLTVLPCVELQPGRRDLSLPIEGACPIGYALWQGDGIADIAALEARFASVLDSEFGSGIGFTRFTGWWDDPGNPRAEKRAALLAEVDAILQGDLVR